MSRTDKDLPYWLTTAWWESYHYRCEHATYGRVQRTCDLPTKPVVERPDPRVNRHCHWWPHRSGWHYGHPPAWYVDHVWASKSRREARDGCLRAVAEHRGSGEVEVEVPTFQHRHGATWLWC